MKNEETAAVGMLSEAEIRRELGAKAGGIAILLKDSVDSTNEELKRILREGSDAAGVGAGENEYILLAANEQTAGKGRAGRSFISERGAGIFMSLSPGESIKPEDAAALTLVMGMAVRSALESFGAENVMIKWPNDIICDGKKICGILAEHGSHSGRAESVVLGVGVNVSNRAFSAELADAATSMYLEGVRDISRECIIARILIEFERYCEIYKESRDMRNLQSEYQRYLINMGRPLEVRDPKGSYTGIGIGINLKGELLVDTGDKISRVIAGDVSVRGI